ncbi:MAG: CBS domain-containing protein [Balneolaceae bacterium]|nr:CBS domain-containing protein [Balneolaceae bacterium]
MLVKEILNTEIAPLRLSDSVSLALTKMDLMNSTKYGVIDNEKNLVGMATLEHLIEVADEQTPLSEVELAEPLYIPVNQHLFEAARLMLAHELLVLPVINESFGYEGIVKRREVLNALGNLFNLSTYGSVITVEVSQKNFTLTEMVHIIETEGAKILSVAVRQPTAENPFYSISFKLNLKDSSVVSAGLRRFGYTVTSEAQSESFEMNFSDRADELIRYLDI